MATTYGEIKHEPQTKDNPIMVYTEPPARKWWLLASASQLPGQYIAAKPLTGGVDSVSNELSLVPDDQINYIRRWLWQMVVPWMDLSPRGNTSYQWVKNNVSQLQMVN